MEDIVYNFSSLEILFIGTFLIGIVFSLLYTIFLKDKELFPKLLGTFLILSLALAANNPIVYSIALIVVATLVTELEFLEKLMALLWSRKEYWSYRLKSQQQQQESTQRAENLERLLNQANVQRDQYLLQAYFEKTYNLIFGSQIRILNLVKENQSVPKQAIMDIYNASIHKDVYPFEEYMKFLEISYLIRSNNNETYSLGPLGNRFLDYITGNNYTLNKFG